MPLKSVFSSVLFMFAVFFLQGLVCAFACTVLCYSVCSVYVVSHLFQLCVCVCVSKLFKLWHQVIQVIESSVRIKCGMKFLCL